MLKRYCGLDPGTKTSGTGLSCITYDTATKQLSQVHVFYNDPHIDKPIEAGHRWDKLLTLRIIAIVRECQKYMQVFKPNEIFIEEPRLLGKANKNMLKLLGCLETMITDVVGADINYIDPSTSKKWVGGHGAADKDAVLNGVKARLALSDNNWFLHNNKICYDLSDASAAVIAGGIVKGYWE